MFIPTLCNSKVLVNSFSFEHDFASHLALMVKNLPVNAGDKRFGFNPWVGRMEGRATHSSILARRIPWAEEPCGLQSIGSQELDTTEAT